MTTLMEEKTRLVNDILNYIENEPIMKGEKNHRLLACFLQHMYERKEKYVPINTLREIIHDCRRQTIDLKLTERALDILGGYAAIDRYTSDNLCLTETGNKVVKHPRFIKLHQK